jgi:hypothetical protein
MEILKYKTYILKKIKMVILYIKYLILNIVNNHNMIYKELKMIYNSLE